MTIFIDTIADINTNDIMQYMLNEEPFNVLGFRRDQFKNIVNYTYDNNSEYTFMFSFEKLNNKYLISLKAIKELQQNNSTGSMYKTRKVIDLFVLHKEYRLHKEIIPNTMNIVIEKTCSFYKLYCPESECHNISINFAKYFCECLSITSYNIS